MVVFCCLVLVTVLMDALAVAGDAPEARPARPPPGCGHYSGRTRGFGRAASPRYARMGYDGLGRPVEGGHGPRRERRTGARARGGARAPRAGADRGHHRM